jgi:alpha-L-rhamnosidase
VIPANTDENLLLNGIDFTENAQVKLIMKTQNSFELEIQPGSYVFESKL